MSHQRILCIVTPPVANASEDLRSDANLGEYDTIIFQPWDVLKGKSQADYSDVQLIQGRLSRLSDWAKKPGRTLVVVLSRVPKAQYREKARAGEPFRPFDVLFALFTDKVRFTETSGNRIEFAKLPGLREFFSNDDWSIKYQYTIQCAGIQPLISVSSAKPSDDLQVVAGILPYGEGRIVFIPPLDAAPSSPQLGGFIDAIPNLLASLSAERSDLPEWTKQWHTDLNAQRRNELRANEEEIDRLRAQNDLLLADMSTERWLSDLYTETGEFFAVAVKKALTELGMLVVDGPHPRADLLVRFREAIGSVEAKGIERGAKEADVRQAERWVADVNHTLASSEVDRKRDADLAAYSNCLQELGLLPDEPNDGVCKGILVLGTFRKVPVDAREADFPDAVLRTLSRSKLCALTGLQLFALVMAAREDPALRTEFAQALFDTTGVLSLSGIHWQKFLKPSGA